MLGLACESGIFQAPQASASLGRVAEGLALVVACLVDRPSYADCAGLLLSRNCPFSWVVS